jgi:hypothetical protein
MNPLDTQKEEEPELLSPQVSLAFLVFWQLHFSSF